MKFLMIIGIVLFLFVGPSISIMFDQEKIAVGISMFGLMIIYSVIQAKDL